MGIECAIFFARASATGSGWLLLWLIFAVVGTMVGAVKGHATVGFVASLILGPFGLLLVLCLPDRSKPKPNTATAPSSPPVPTPPGARTYRIAKGGEDLGEVSVTVIKMMLASGNLSPSDFYLDTTLNEWKPLSGVVGL